MEWQQFEYFRTLARLQHVTRAAEELSITQPALSRSIARFEEEMGVVLFERQGRSIKLNQYGHILLNSVDNMMKEFNRGKQEIQDLLNPEEGQVSLGFLHTLSTDLIPDLIADFRIKYPKINFLLRQSPSHLLLEQLQGGELDLCLISPMDIKEPVHWKKLWSERLFLIVPKNHKLANRKSILLEDIADEPFIHLKEGFSLRIVVEKLFKEVGITPTVTFEGEEVQTVAGLVSAGLGVSIIPNIKGIDPNKLVQVKVEWPDCYRLIGIAEIEGRYLSPAAEKFKKFILNKFESTIGHHI